ncbi:hypothetical protein [Phytohalomonas tamaricis]|uniref:hypothetical protein n=1 Tax=Phytohalomonas tamaricis TaxID=2081032 RepID=UPI000D0BABF5|nr:hypothetical protein [Phytohalomonas tamaricis]
MKKLIATAFCAAFTLPAMQTMAAGNEASGNNANSAVQQESQRNSQVPTNNPTGDGQEYMGSKADSQPLNKNGSSSKNQGNATDSATQQKSQRNSEVPANNPSGHGQEYMGTKSDSQKLQGQNSSSGSNPNGSGPDETGSAAAVTDTGRQGHSAQMEEKVSPGGPTEQGDSPGDNKQ